MSPSEVPSESLFGFHQRSVRLTLALIWILAVLSGFAVFTHRFAGGLGHHEKLGPPWIAAGAVPIVLPLLGTLLGAVLLGMGLWYRSSRPHALLLVPVIGFFLAL